MPLRLPDHLPAIELLQKEGIVVGSLPAVAAQECRPLQIVILNLMPIKITTEVDLVRILSHSPLLMDITLMRIKSHTPTHTPREHMERFYTDCYALRDRTFDGMIITGAPVEMLNYEEVTYWQELTVIFRWAETHVRSTLYLCWAAQAALYWKYGIPKYRLAKKCFGIFQQTILVPAVPLFRGFHSTFMMPHSRHTEVRRDDIQRQEALLALAEAEETGVSVLLSQQGQALYVMGHFEYPAGTLDTEYRRDVGKRDDVGLPKNYYNDDNPNLGYTDTWSKQGTLFYQNWLRYYVAPSP